MSKCIEITGENFESEVIQSSTPVFLDFWAAWCGPCRMVGPIVEQLADEYDGKLKVGKINVDEETDLATRHSIVSIPALVVYNKGEIVNQTVGALPKPNMEALFKELL